MIEGGGNARRGCQVTRRGWADRSPPSPPEWRNKTNETASDGKRPISLSVDRALGAFSLQRDRSALGGAAGARPTASAAPGLGRQKVAPSDWGPLVHPWVLHHRAMVSKGVRRQGGSGRSAQAKDPLRPGPASGLERRLGGATGRAISAASQLELPTARLQSVGADPEGSRPGANTVLRLGRALHEKPQPNQTSPAWSRA